jgi:hypothetical protein
MATAISNTTIPDIFAQTIPQQPRIRKRKSSGKTVNKQLNEVIYGQRSFLQVYSKTLQRSICFVNEGLMNPKDLDFDGKIITMEMLADMVTNENSVF